MNTKNIIGDVKLNSLSILTAADGLSRTQKDVDSLNSRLTAIEQMIAATTSFATAELMFEFSADDAGNTIAICTGLSGMTGEAPKITIIPGYYNGYPVHIGAAAFLDHVGIDEVICMPGISVIADEAFSGSTLTKIILPNTLTTIDDYAFAYCQSLSAVEFNTNWTKPLSLGASVFEGCENLTALNLPDNIVAIGEECFADCSSLTTITCNWDQYAFGGAPWGAANTTTIKYVADKFAFYVEGGYAYGDDTSKNPKFGYYTIKGVGDLYFNNTLWQSYTPTSSSGITKYADTKNDRMAIVTLSNGEWNHLQPLSDQPSGSYNKSQVMKIHQVRGWNKNQDYLPTEFIAHMSIPATMTLNLPSHLTHLRTRTFMENTLYGSIIFPASIKKFETKTFEEFGGTSTATAESSYLRFLHAETDVVELPASGLFNTKSTTYFNIETDNPIIKNYNYAADNVVPTFYHLDGSLWED